MIYRFTLESEYSDAANLIDAAAQFHNMLAFPDERIFYSVNVSVLSSPPEKNHLYATHLLMYRDQILEDEY